MFQQFWEAQQRLARVRSDYYLFQARNVTMQERFFRMMANFWNF